MEEKEQEVYDEIMKGLGDGVKNWKGYLEFVKVENYPSLGMIFGTEVIKDLAKFTEESDTYPEVIEKLRKKHKLTQFQIGVFLGHFMTIQSIRSGMNVAV